MFRKIKWNEQDRKENEKSTVARNIFIFTKSSESNKMDLHNSLKYVRCTKGAEIIIRG